ncbi:hypothetical protein [Salinicola rhizosphaerae]|uniref:hypothetical protein n=1 Tax=Salinicola rhizosphaerae TaxID=1443141 RepID=UPI001E2F34B4|nr:hypothetical protein [Salinicola rhizosphaerae]
MSLDGPRDDDVEQAWSDEIVRRASKAKSGRGTMRSREEFRSKMRARRGQEMRTLQMLGDELKIMIRFRDIRIERNA